MLDQDIIGKNEDNTSYFQLNNERKQYGLLKGNSLFSNINERNCSEANIPESLCSCGTFLDINNMSSVVKLAAIYLVDYINEVILKDSKNICVKYELNEIIDSQMIIDGSIKKYLIIFKVSPNNAVFDGTVIENDLSSTELGKKFNLDGQIQRISTYGTTSSCVTIYFLRSYCYCKN